MKAVVKYSPFRDFLCIIVENRQKTGIEAMITRRSLMAGAACGMAAGCAVYDPKLIKYDGPRVDTIQVLKSKRKMQLFHGSTVLRTYDIELGFGPEGHKTIEGDGRTPEGAYLINRKNPNSRFHLSIGISYPNINDVRKARSMGKSPGGEIFIHGTPKLYVGDKDWTWGCIAVTDAEMEEIYAMIDVGTQINIYP